MDILGIILVVVFVTIALAFLLAVCFQLCSQPPGPPHPLDLEAGRQLVIQPSVRLNEAAKVKHLDVNCTSAEGRTFATMKTRFESAI